MVFRTVWEDIWQKETKLFDGLLQIKVNLKVALLDIKSYNLFKGAKLERKLPKVASLLIINRDSEEKVLTSSGPGRKYQFSVSSVIPF